MNGNWWETDDIEELRCEYARLRSRHESVLSAINILEEEQNDLLYSLPSVELQKSSIDRFIKRVDEILERKQEVADSHLKHEKEKIYAYSWGKRGE